MSEQVGFTVALNDQPPGCAVRGCRESVGYVAELRYCTCGEAHRVGTPCGIGGDPEGCEERVRLCEKHAAGVRPWECLRRITSTSVGASS